MTEIVYKSVFHQEFRDLIELKQALGFAYTCETRAFKQIDSFFIKEHLAEKIITKELYLKWAAKRSYETTNNQAHRISEFRVFCRYLVDVGIPAYIPPKLAGFKKVKYDAHIYTDDELRRFFEAVDLSQSVPSECPYRGVMLPVFFRILYTSGLRVSELRLAKVADMDFERNCLHVTHAKNHKERLVPIHPVLMNKCLKIRNIIHADSSDNEYFFMITIGRAMTLQNLYNNFRRYLDRAGISHTGRGPRIHDFRHTYCVNLLRKWTDEGKDLMAWMPYMRTMLGHEGFEETAYYLKLTMERFPYIRDKLKKSFPNIIEEAEINEAEFY